MATQEEILKILLQVQGVDEVQRLQKEQEKLEADMLKLTTAMQGQNAATIAADPAMQRLANQYHTNTQRLTELDRQLGNTRNGMAGMGQSFLQTGRIVQDFAQGGIGGILNNIEGLSQALGGGPGLAGIMTALGVAAFIARPYIEDFIKSMDTDDVGTFAGSIETLKTRIKELESKKVRISIDDAELKRLTKEVENLTKAAQFANQLLTKQTKAESASGRAVEDALVETPGTQDAIAKARQATINKAIDESKTVKENRDKIAEKQAQLDKENATIAAPGTGPGARIVAQLNARNLTKELEALREANKEAIHGKGGIVEKEGAIFDQIEMDAITGKGKIQAAAQKKLAAIVGVDSKAGKAITDNSPQRVVEKEEASNDADAAFDALEESNDRAKKFRLEKAAADKKRKRQEIEEEENRQRVAKGEGEEDTKTNKALGKAPPTAEEIAKGEKKDADFNAKVNEAGQKADDELLGLKTRSGASIADLYAQQRMQISMLPKGQQAKAMQQLDMQSQQAVMQSLIAKGAMPAEAQFKSGTAAGRLDRIFQAFAGQSGQAANAPAPRPNRVLGKRNRAIAAREAAKHAKTVGPRKVGNAGDKDSKDLDKSVSLQSDMAKSLARIEANTGDALRAKNVAILG